MLQPVPMLLMLLLERLWLLQQRLWLVLLQLRADANSWRRRPLLLPINADTHAGAMHRSGRLHTPADKRRWLLLLKLRAHANSLRRQLLLLHIHADTHAGAMHRNSRLHPPAESLPRQVRLKRMLLRRPLLIMTPHRVR